MSSAAGTGMVKTPWALTVPVKGLSLTVKVTVSPAANLPVTLPVTLMLPLFSAALIRLSEVMGSRSKAVVLPAVASVSTW